MIFTKKNIIGALVIALVITLIGLFFFSLGPVSDASTANKVIFRINPGDGFRTVANDLRGVGLIRSALSFELFALLDGHASELKAGTYQLSPSMDIPSIIAMISGGNGGVVTVTIPEGSNIYDIDRILSNAMVIRKGDLINSTSSRNMEGKLFPDTYQFHMNASIAVVIQKMSDDFDLKALPLLNSDPVNESRDLIIASMLEKEVPAPLDRQIVAGIILKRLSQGIALDIDATVCYAKFRSHPTSTQGCYPLTPLDFKIDSPYNTYLYKGLPLAPIGNPGTSAITAAIHPQVSPYLYYLSDPKTGKTIFAKTLDEQTQNKVKYLEGN